MKKNLLKIFCIVIFTLILIMLLNTTKSEAYTATFNDFSAIKQLDNKYSYGTMFWTEKTEVIPIIAPYISTPEACKVGEGYYKSFGAEENQVIEIKITNCAVDEDNDFCDVVMTLTPVANLKGFNHKDRWTSRIFTGDDLKNFEASGKIFTNILSIKGSMVLENKRIPSCNPGNLMFFELNTLFAESKLTLKYYKTGTNNEANINGVSGFMSNINVPTSIYNEPNMDYSKLACNGNECVVPTYDSKIYYDFSSSIIKSSKESGGVYCYGPYKSQNWKNNSCVILEDEKAKFEILYGGTGCGLDFGFFSPYQFSIPEPNMIVDKNVVYENEEYNVQISQYIPNNYYSNIINLIDSNSFYSSFKLIGKVNGYKYKQIDLNKIKVFNSIKNDVSSMFDISLKDGVVTATLKSEYLQSEKFYNDIYYLNIPLKYLENDENKTAKDFTVDGLSNISGEEKNCKSVETTVQINIQVKKIWNDKNNKFSIRPQNIMVDILK